ncbi:MAG: heat shock protein HspQ [Rickettsiales bacterium]|nr:heat shock protein HspQ [Rickettsiales bacterium]
MSQLEIISAKFGMGQKIRHKLFDYRGVILDVDSDFQLSDDWYKKMAKTQPAKDEPWYHVLVHESAQMTYVAEANLQTDASEEKIDHPVIDLCFDIDAQGKYQRRLNVQ